MIIGNKESKAHIGAGTPEKKNFFQSSCSAFNDTLNLASLIEMQMTYIITNIHPITSISFNFQKYKRNAGAAPKFRKSAKESSCAPKSLVDFRILAILPSIPSIIAAMIIKITANSHCSLNVNLSEVRPEHKPNKVIKFGNNLVTGRDLLLLPLLLI
jgi:hypothetical protein